jgi:hypothetical protein
MHMQAKVRKTRRHAHRHHIALFYLIAPHCLFQLTMTKSTFVTQHLYIYSGFTSAEGSPSYTLLVMDTYCGVSTWP